MKYEVEQKFPVPDLASVEAKLTELGAVIQAERREVDLYFAHPARDFPTTDEALRIRQIGNSFRITYKGPKIDPTTKTRREIELPLPSDGNTLEAWKSLLGALGFSPVSEVAKTRRKAKVAWRGRQVEVCLDEVDEVGTFVELELVTVAEDIEAAKACIAALAASLGLSDTERRSYLELLLERRASA